MEPQHSLFVQLEQKFKLGGHGVDLGGTFVVVVVVRERLRSVRVSAERPEPVEVDVIAKLQRQTRHDQPSAEASGSQALRSPERGESVEVLWVEEDGVDRAVEILDGVKGTHGKGSVVAIGEGGD